MGKDPAFMLYSQDFLVGVSDLTMEERGQYITLLCTEHQKGRLSKKLINLTVGNASEDVLSKFDVDDNGLYYNERLEEEIDKRSKYAESRSANGSKGGRPRKETTEKPQENHMVNICKPYAKAYEKAYENHSENENINENIIKNRIDYNSFMYIYNAQCFNLSQIIKLTDKRKKAISTFLRSMTKEDFEQVCIKANNTPFLIGENTSGWKASFDFVIKPDNATKILEGAYNGSSKKGGLDFMDLI